MFTFTQSEAQAKLMKPVQITGVVNELIALETANVITSNTVSDVVKLIFAEIQSDTLPLRQEWSDLISSVKDQTEYLTRTTDELNEKVGKTVIPSHDRSTYQIYVNRVNELYDEIKDGMMKYSTMRTDYDTLDREFYDGVNADYNDDYFNLYPVMSYDSNSISQIVDSMYTSESMLISQQNLLSDLRTEFPEIAIESTTMRQATYLPNTMYVKLLANSLFRIYEDIDQKRDIGTYFNKESLIAERDETYTIHVLNAQPPDDTRKFMVLDHVDGADPATVPLANTILIAQGSANNVIKGHQIRSMAFEGTGMNAGKPVFNNDIAYESGKNSVIRYDKDHTV